jgi:hypothetical protein
VRSPSGDITVIPSLAPAIIVPPRASVRPTGVPLIDLRVLTSPA